MAWTNDFDHTDLQEIVMELRRGLLLMGTLAALVGCGGGGNKNGGTSGGGGGTGSTSGTGSVGASGVPLYVLIGGASKPSGTDIYLDSSVTRGSNVSSLDSGEIFILPKDPLLTSRSYQVHIDAATSVSGESYTLNFTFTTGALDPSTPAGTALDRLNVLRGQSGVPAVASHANFVNAATKHSGYQCQRGTITHGETSGVSFFVDDYFANRISLANGGGTTPSTWNWAGSDQVYEDIDTVGGTIAVDRLWNSVYHRLPMMRAQVYRIGNGDRSNAVVHVNNSSPVISAGGNGYHTIEFGGDSSISTPSGIFWPSNGLTGVPARFQTDFEGPDPVDAGNGNGTPTDNSVGTPIHAIFPTVNSFTSLNITVTLVP